PWLPGFRREVAETHRPLFAERAAEYSPSFRRKLERAFAVTDAEAEAGRREQARYGDRCLEAMAEVDLLLTPTLPCLPPPAGARPAGRPPPGTAPSTPVFPPPPPRRAAPAPPPPPPPRAPPAPPPPPRPARA